MTVQSVLCAVDFAPSSARAFVHAADLAERLHARLHLVHVTPLFRARLAHDGGDADEAFRRSVVTFVNRALGSDDAFDVVAPDVHHVNGRPPADGVLECARDLEADLVVIGTHGRKGIQHLIMGSVAVEVVRRSEVPVWVVPERAAPGTPGPLRPVVVALDLAESTVPLLRLGGQLAESFHAPLVPVHARTTGSETFIGTLEAATARGTGSSSRSRLDARALVAEAVEEAGVEVGDTYVVPDAPSTSVVSVAERARAGLVVMGTHGRAGLERLHLGSVAEHVARHAPCPVLTVPARW